MKMIKYYIYYYYNNILNIRLWGLEVGDWGLGIGPNPQSPNIFHIFLFSKKLNITLNKWIKWRKNQIIKF